MDLPQDELDVLLQALNEVLNGPAAIDEWEFETRMGLSRDEAKALLRRLASAP